MVERPILFSSTMVRAILADQKTQTRRLMKPQPDCFGLEHSATITPHPSGSGEWLLQRWPKQERQMHNIGRCEVVKPCPYGQPGDRLWVRETWAPFEYCYEDFRPSELPPCQISYLADLPNGKLSGDRYRPSIHMPRWASRINLQITWVRVERLQDISEADARAEGAVVEMVENEFGVWVKSIDGKLYPNAVQAFGVAVWSSIHAADGPNGLAANPWVWVVQFERLEKEAV